MNNHQKNKAIIFDFNRTLFNPETDTLMPFAKEILEHCIQSYDCYLISYDEGNRKSLLDDLGISRFFKKIALVSKKTRAHFEEIIKPFRYDAVYVVGDRIKGEIALGNELHYTTIWYQNGKFATQLPQETYEHPRHTITSLQELIAIIS